MIRLLTPAHERPASSHKESTNRRHQVRALAVASVTEKVD